MPFLFIFFLILAQAFDELDRRDVYDWAKKDKVIILEEDLEIGTNQPCSSYPCVFLREYICVYVVASKIY